MIDVGKTAACSLEFQLKLSEGETTVAIVGNLLSHAHLVPKKKKKIGFKLLCIKFSFPFITVK